MVSLHNNTFFFGYSKTLRVASSFVLYFLFTIGCQGDLKTNN